MRLEITETIDVARDGVLLHRDEDSLALMSRVWIAFPFDANDSAPVQPETPARILRAEGESGGGYRVALQLEQPRRESREATQQERRASPRIQFSLPIFVRPAGTPFPEESMTHDFSWSGVRFETSHVYSTGEAVLAKISWGEWAEAGEISGRVVRVEAVDSQPDQPANVPSGVSAVFSCVAVQWTDRESERKCTAQARRHSEKLPRNGSKEK